MIWIAPSETDAATDTLEKRLWAAADQFRAKSGLKSREYFLGEFYTPSGVLRLLTAAIESYHGRILNPACGPGKRIKQSWQNGAGQWDRTGYVRGDLPNPLIRP